MESTDPSWVERLYEAEAANFILYGRALGLSHAESEDVLQETFLALTRRPEAPVEAQYYALRSFRNRALNYKRSLWRRILREFESHRWFEPQEEETNRERAAMRCLAALPSAQREVIVLKIWHHHTFESIGRLLGISPNTAAGRYRYGMQKLKVRLQGEAHELIESTRDSVAILETSVPCGSD